MNSTEHCQTLLEQRQHRIDQAITLQKPDRTPAILGYAGLAAGVTNTSVKNA